MSVTPVFLTGAYAVIKVAGKKLAFCRGISYRISVPHSNDKVLGMYESADLQPQSYDISGTFSVYRYVADVKNKSGAEGPSPTRGDQNTIQPEGNGVGTFGVDGLAGMALFGAAFNNFNPAYLMYGTSFDIVIYQMSERVNTTEANFTPVAVLRKCRLVTSDFNLMKREVATQTFSFVANYADEDSFVAGFSGAGAGW